VNEPVDESDLQTPEGVRRCRVCGCTDEFCCGPDGCSWVDWDLCSVCDADDDSRVFHSHKVAVPKYRDFPPPRRVA
jgi:hypothetical protein